MPHTNPDAAPAFYRIEGALAHPSPDTRGPWDPNAQHGGAPTALIAWTVDRMASAAPMRIARITVDLFRPVPIAPLEVRTDVLREGRNIQLVEVRLVAQGKECVRAAVLRIRDAATAPPEAVRPPPPRWPSPDERPRIENFAREGLARHLDIRAADGRIRDRNAAPIWFRLRTPFIEGQPNAPLVMAAIAAGRGTAFGVLSDTSGAFGRAAQSLVIAPRG